MKGLFAGIAVAATSLFSRAQAQSASSSATAPAVTCTGSWKPVTAQDYVSALDPGWNLGNTLDAIEDEGDWGNAPVTEDTFDDIVEAGFNSVRLPVTWAYHLLSEAPDYEIDPVWLDRVENVTSMVTKRGLRAIVNVHHDSWTWADITKPDADIPQIQEKFYALWYQIGTKLACTSELVSFEPINEPPGTTQEHAAEINELNNIFLQAIKDAGGWNPDRVVTLVGPTQDSIKTSLWFEPPSEEFKNPWAIQFHYYSPYDYVFLAWGRSYWGSDADKEALEADFANIRGNFTDVPLVIGEWGATIFAAEDASRWNYIDFMVSTAKKYNISTIVWDNGFDMLDRPAHTWRDLVSLDVFVNAANNISNALPKSTIDGSAPTQESSAYIYHKVGAPVEDVTLSFELNGNNLTEVQLDCALLEEEEDYTVSGSDITFPESFLTANDLTPMASPGIKGTLTLMFSPGAPLDVALVQWDLPTISNTSSPAIAGQQVNIPVDYKGINKVAAVKAITSDGTYLFDEWTSVLGPLQQARITYDGQWSYDDENLILRSGVSDAVLAKGQNTTFTFEFFPRVGGNVLNYTLTV